MTISQPKRPPQMSISIFLPALLHNVLWLCGFWCIPQHGSWGRAWLMEIFALLCCRLLLEGL